MNLQKIKHSCAALLIISFVLLPISHQFSIKYADAYIIPVIDAANLSVNVESAVTLGIIAADTTLIAADTTLIAKTAVANDSKEFGWDAVAWAAVNMLIEEMINSVTQWVASGFDGNPAFLTDFRGFLTGVADQAAGEFLAGNGALSFLCEPFSFDINMALGLNYYQSGDRYKPQCTLSTVVDNMDDFIDGDFSSGGWAGWDSLTLNKNNNPYGAALNAQIEFEANINRATGREKNLLDFGGGFFTDKDCKNVNGKEVCTYKTPGIVIEKTLNNALDLPNKRLSIADEIDELIGALLMQFVKALLSETGLSGFNADSNIDDRTTMPPDPVDRERPQGPDATIENAYQLIKVKILTLIGEKKAYCSVEFERELPASIMNQYDDLKTEVPKIHTDADVAALEAMYVSIKQELDLFVKNKCRA